MRPHGSLVQEALGHTAFNTTERTTLPGIRVAFLVGNTADKAQLQIGSFESSDEEQTELCEHLIVCCFYIIHC